MSLRTNFLPLILFVLALQALDAQNLYTISRKIPMGGNEFWDHLAVDEQNDRLLVTHGTMLQSLDLDKGRVVDSISGLNGAHSIALAPDLNKGFVTNGRSNTVTVFDLSTYAVLATIQLSGNDPDALVYDKATQFVFVMNAKSASASIIRAASNEIAKDIPLPGKPSHAVNDGKGSIYVSIEDKSEIAVISTKSLKVERTFAVAPGENPGGLAIDVFNNRLYVGCANRLFLAVDSRSGKIVAKVTIAEFVDDLAFDPVASKVFCASHYGTMSIVDVIDENSYKLFQTMATTREAHACVYHPKRHTVYTSAAEHVYPAVTGEQVHPKPVPKPNSFSVYEVIQKK